MVPPDECSFQLIEVSSSCFDVDFSRRGATLGTHVTWIADGAIFENEIMDLTVEVKVLLTLCSSCETEVWTRWFETGKTAYIYVTGTFFISTIQSQYLEMILREGHSVMNIICAAL